MRATQMALAAVLAGTMAAAMVYGRSVYAIYIDCYYWWSCWPF